MSTQFIHSEYDAVVIGGGFYGCSIAAFLSGCYKRVVLIERESDLLQRASLVNQARVHNGYHYPRSYMTALRSHLNFPRFVADYKDCIDSSFEKVYAIARNNSRINANQFQRTLNAIGAPVREANPEIRKLFDKRMVEGVFSVDEYAFNAVTLKELLSKKLDDCGVEVHCNVSVDSTESDNRGRIIVNLLNSGGITAGKVINCTYAGMNGLLTRSGQPRLPFKYEIAELALVELPEEIRSIGVTLMDGPFFSVMPFPSRSLHSLSHVRYTPHEAWTDEDPDSEHPLDGRQSNCAFMIRDAKRYLPALEDAKHVDSIFEVKTVLLQNEHDDGRPILFRRDYGLPNYAVVMGGKIDNIYDILQKIEESGFVPHTQRARAS